MRKNVTFTLNGASQTLEVDVRESLLETIRERLHLTGTKKACGAGECGACTVLVDNENINSCIYLTIWANGKKVETIEGQEYEGKLSPIQEAYLSENAVQCGFCSPGFIMSTKALLHENPRPTEEEIKEGLAGNMCRCTGYQNIVRAVQKLSCGEAGSQAGM